MRIIYQVQRYKKIPSQILGITDEYEAFCFDEAVGYIQSQMYFDYNDEGRQKWRKQPHWIDDNKPQNNEELFKMIQNQNRK